MKIKSAILAMVLTHASYATTLEEALISTYNTNQTLKQYRMDFLVSAEGCAEARSGYFPDISAQVEVDHSLSRPKSRYKDSNNDPILEALGIDVSKTKKRVVQNTLAVKQNLFNGQTYATVKAVNLAFKAARAQLESQEQKVLFDAVTAYLDYELAKAKYDASNASVNFNSKNVEAIEAKLKVGEANNTEVAIAQSGLSNAKSEQAQAFSDLEGKKADFLEKIGIVPSETESSKLPNLPASLAEFKAKVLEFSPSLEYARQNAKSSKAQIAAVAGSLLPSLDLQFAFTRTHNDPETRSSYNRSGVTSALTLSIPIFSKGGASYSKLRQTKYQARKAAYAADYQARQIDSQIIFLWESLQSLRSALESATVALEAQQLAFDGTMQEFKLGLKDILAVLKVESDLTKVKINKATVLRNYIFQAYQMKMFMGELTAKKLQLKVDYFDPNKELRKIKAPLVHF
ncbi:TolC family protein [Candidatus Phycorickettsia trachydisci]|nr:TolC family protein [Candidatus Phycorickettsia trachydisci]